MSEHDVARILQQIDQIFSRVNTIATDVAKVCVKIDVLDKKLTNHMESEEGTLLRLDGRLRNLERPHGG